VVRREPVGQDGVDPLGDRSANPYRRRRPDWPRSFSERAEEVRETSQLIPMLALDSPIDAEIKVKKMDAARRQLKTAVRLWFDDSDPVSVHTLALAAYGILHTIPRKRGESGLLFDSFAIKKEMRNDWAKLLREQANFFKHADRDPEGEVSFALFANEVFILFSIMALSKMGEPLELEERAFLGWHSMMRPHLVKEELRNNLPPVAIEQFRGMSGRQFFEEFSRFCAGFI
jgi:hypothetical protein